MHRLHPRTQRRGNTLVLVTAILVLLVIVATAYITRTRVGRATAAAQQQATIVEDRSESIAKSLASEVSEALFVRPVQTPVASNGLFGGTVSSNWPRLPIFSDEVRYGVDPARETIADPITGEDRSFYLFPYNKAPYAVIPWTNWPDGLGATSSPWPIGPGAPTGLVALPNGAPIGDGNPYGNPGFDDSRWLRSTEPQRSTGGFNGVPVEGFTHWLHLSNISRPDNGWRIAWDISDIRLAATATAAPNVLDNLLIPVEQWLPSVVPNGIASQADFNTRRANWFGESAAAGAFYAQAYLAPNTALPNLFRLKDLGPAGDEFRRNSDRWLVSTLFNDADGDGFTDSFWFLAPEPVDRDVRQVVGISIVDHGGLLDLNVATLFDPRSTTGANPGDLALLGVDTLPVGFLDNPMNQPPAQVYNVAPPSGEGTAFAGSLTGTLAWDPARYGLGTTPDRSMLLQQRGLRDLGGRANPLLADRTYDEDLQGTLLSPRERLAFFNGDFLRGGPENLGLTPFGTPEELELRANHGQNNPAVTTRLERAFDDGGSDFAFLRATPFREETSEYLDQLNNPQLVHDARRKLTAFSGVRNDVASPWLWPTPRFETSIDYNRDGYVLDEDGSGVPNAQALFAADRATWDRQRRKLDLRRPMDEPTLDTNGNLVAAAPADIVEARRIWRQDLHRLLKQSFTLDYTFRDGATRAYQSLLGTLDDTLTEGRDAWTRTRKMLASHAANIDQHRDGPERRTFPDGSVAWIDRPLNPRNIQEAVIFPDPNDPAETVLPGDRVAFVGNEKHPVIVEVFFALVFEKTRVDPSWQAAGGPAAYGQYGCPWSPGQGENFVQFEEGNLLTPNPKVIFAVQIANPYDTPIHLADFSIRVAGRNVPLALAAQQLSLPLDFVLQPTTPERPCSLILYSIPQAGGVFGAQFRQKWLDYLDLQAIDLFDDETNDSIPDPDSGVPTPRPETMLVDGTPFLNLPWDVFESPDVESVELVRTYLDDAGANPISLVVDRFAKTDIDSASEFSEFASRLYRPEALPPPPKFELVFLPPPPPNVPDPDQTWYSGIRIRDADFLVTWARASRLWLLDSDGNGFIDLDERSPRFAVSHNTEVSVVTRTNPTAVDENGAERPNYYLGDDIDGDGETPDDPDAVSDADMWLTGFTFESQFSSETAGNETVRSKPTFFPMQVVVEAGARTYEGYQDVPFQPIATSNVRWGEKGAPSLDDYRADEAFGRFPFQLSQKDSDFEQIGEVANVMLWGPEVRYPIPGNGQAETVRTLSEILADEDDLASETHPIERGVYRNRLRTFPGFEVGLAIDPDTNEIASYPTTDERPETPVLGAAPSGLTPDQQSEWEAFFALRPRLPAGIGFFDGIVCDDRGARLRDADGDGDADFGDLALLRFLSPANARAFTGAATPGLINLNTAPVEVLRTLPHATRMVYDDSDYEGSLGPGEVTPVPPAASPRVRLPEAFLRYRDGASSPSSARVWGEGAANLVDQPLPNYLDRGLREGQLAGFDGFFPGMRNHRGVESIGELRLLQRVLEGGDDGSWSRRLNSSIEFAGLDPYRGPSDPIDADFGYRGQQLAFDSRLATDRAIGLTSTNPNDQAAFLVPDRTAGDAEERNLLFNGIANLVGVRSDVFTVYFRVRTFRRNPITSVWDATDPEHILDDSRYVMVVDRSKVERPEDKPKILFLQKLAY